MEPSSSPVAAPPLSRPGVAIISHRTHLGTHPENSRSGLEAALASGVDGVEIDVRATRDGHIVLMHDRSLMRTHGDPRDVDQVDYADLLRLSPTDGPGGETVPSLEEALARCAGRARLVIDVKQAGIAASLEAMLHAYSGRTEAWVWTHDPAIARECIDALAGAVPVSLIVRPAVVETWNTIEAMHLARTGGLNGLLFEHPYVDAPLLERAAEAGLTLHCGRTNDPGEIARILALAPASMCSDYPERGFAMAGALAAVAA